MLFLDPYECLVSITTNGLLTFYGVGNSRLKNKILFEKQYMREWMIKNLGAFPATAVKFDQGRKMLLLGDEFGNIQGWSL